MPEACRPVGAPPDQVLAERVTPTPAERVVVLHKKENDGVR
jgi:hypothetical protein